MAHYERTEECPEGVEVVHTGPFDIPVPESGRIAVPRSQEAAFADAAQNGFFVKVDDDEVPEPDAEAAAEASGPDADSDNEPRTDAPVPPVDRPPVDERAALSETKDAERGGFFS